MRAHTTIGRVKAGFDACHGVLVQHLTKFNLGLLSCTIVCIVGIVLEVILKRQLLTECPAYDRIGS